MAVAISCRLSFVDGCPSSASFCGFVTATIRAICSSVKNGGRFASTSTALATTPGCSRTYAVATSPACECDTRIASRVTPSALSPAPRSSAAARMSKAPGTSSLPPIPARSYVMICAPVASDSRGTIPSQYDESSPPPASSTIAGRVPGVTWNASRWPARSTIRSSAPVPALTAGLAFVSEPGLAASGAALHAVSAPTVTTGRTRARNVRMVMSGPRSFRRRACSHAATWTIERRSSFAVPRPRSILLATHRSRGLTPSPNG